MALSSARKRRIASALAIISTVATKVPALIFLVPWLNYLAAGLGLVGLVHAAQKKDVLGAKAASLTAALKVLQETIVQFFPFLIFLVPVIDQLAALFGTAALTDKNTKK